MAPIIEQVGSTNTPNEGRQLWNDNDLALDTRVKQFVHAATTAALPTNVVSNANTRLTASANGAMAAHDGVTLTAGQDLLVKNEATAANNGIYRLTQVGSGAAPWILDRRDDAASSENFNTRTILFVHGGTTQAGLWTFNVSGTYVLGTTAQVWTQFSSGGGGGGYATIQDEGTPLIQRTVANYAGAAVVASDNPGATRTDVTIYNHLHYPFSTAGTLTTKVGASRFPIHLAGTILAVRATVGTAPTGAAIILDVNKNGTTIYTTQANRPQIAISGNSVTSTNMDVTSVAANDYCTVDVDQVGSTIAGSDLVVSILVRH